MTITTEPTTPKRVVRRKKTTTVSSTTLPESVTSSVAKLTPITQSFSELLTLIENAKNEFEQLQKEIAETKELWLKEQKDHETQLRERNIQEEITKRREQETYEYETALRHKKEEDEFLQRKAQWERELSERKEELAKEKQELVLLRKQVESFEEEKEKAIKEACTLLQKDLTEKFTTERKLREQEVRSEKELLQVRITNFVSENTRLATEVATLKKSLVEATDQVKEIAVKVIESGSTPKTPVPSQTS